MNTAALSRRHFMRLAGGGLTVVLLPGCAIPVIPKRPAPDLDAALGWVRYIDGRYTLWLPRVEMGQNVLTALKQIACAELGVSWELLDARLPSTRDIGRVKATVGSDSIKDYAVPLAQACALLREAVALGGFDAKAEAPPATALRFLQPGALAQHVPLEQGPAIVTGQALYAADVRRTGMVYGRVLYAPSTPEFESAPLSWDEAAARAVPGFVALVRDDGFSQGRAQGLGIVARTPGALDRIEQALALRWQMQDVSARPSWQEQLDVDRALARHGKLPHGVHDETVALDGPWDLDLRFDIPPAAHAAIEPRAAVAEFHARGHLQLWVGNQDVFYVRDVVAKRLGLGEDEITVQAQRVGGAFGGRTICTVELEAALLARAVQRPVKVQWTRAQEFRQAFHRPPSSHRVRVRLQDGQLQDWWHAFVSGHILFTNAAMPPWLQSISHFLGDNGVARGARLPYRARSKETRFALERLPLLSGPWRGLGAGPNHFVTESVLDECARRAGRDPLAYRLAHIEDARLARVLQRVAQLARWGEASPTRRDGLRHGRGLACGIYKDMSYAAVVADVTVDAAGGVRVRKLWCAHDCGRVINAEQVRAQCEGNLVWGLGMVLVEGLRFEGQGVAATSFAASPIPRWDDVPELEVALVDHGEPPTGAGETAIVAAGAAIANAIRAATGVRLLTLPCAADLLRA
ncbi:MAG: molybdopterin-dependent oxidoreductase [Hylemonella sp.]|uniref:xanthine dehydrogenase family protein molybdopterin-binding subunit n=1 Tax=Hylemonella sp. TaxID=2066020 RepID=UPI0022BD899A|nr:molybdopterin cofactor-binding domain-containing protein [Hylemonella sp.]MCZ8252151.1 molybdopterin-dependent oxidoreductase [Hylemonella sp.]